MKVTTVLLFVAGYVAAEYAAFQHALAVFPPQYRPGVAVLGICVVFASLFDRYVVTPHANATRRSRPSRSDLGGGDGDGA